MQFLIFVDNYITDHNQYVQSSQVLGMILYMWLELDVMLLGVWTCGAVHKTTSEWKEVCDSLVQLWAVITPLGGFALNVLQDAR